jgi:O-antigen/teichoic acid export membrane protein
LINKRNLNIKKLLKTRLINDSFWSLFGNIINKGLAIIAGIIIARLLGKDIFGEYSLIKSTFVSAALLSGFGLQYTTTKFIAEYRKNDKTKLKIIIKYSNRIVLFLSGLLALFFILKSDYIANEVLKAKYLNNYIRLFGIVTILNAMTSLQVGFLAGFGEFKRMSRVNIFIGIVTFIASVVLVYYKGFFGAMLTLVLVQALNLFLNNRLVYSSLPSNILYIEEDRDLLIKLVKFSTPIALQEAVYSILNWTIVYLVLRYDSFGEVGIYRASLQLNGIILFIPNMLRNVVLSHLSEVENDNHKHANVMNTVLGISFVVTLIPVLILYFAADYITLLYGKTYEGLGSVIRTAVFITIFEAISNVYMQAYMSKGMNWVMLSFRIFKFGGMIILFLILVNSFKSGSLSMIYSQLTFSALFVLLVAFYYKKKNI